MVSVPMMIYIFISVLVDMLFDRKDCIIMVLMFSVIVIVFL